MRTFTFLTTLIAFGLIFMAATCQQISGNDISKLDKRIEMSKGACFGTCPVYDLTIYEGGAATYFGTRFTDKMGLYGKTLSAQVYQDLIKAFDAADMWRFQNAYKAQVPDLPTVTITYHRDGETKSVKGKDGRPAAIEDLEILLDAIANSGGWEQKEDSGNYGMDADVIANELIVNLSTEVDPNVWIIQFAKQDMAIKNRISPNSPYWVFTFNPNKMVPEEMISFVRRDPYVLSAEFNRRVNASGRD